MRSLPFIVWTALMGCTAVTTTPVSSPQTFSRDEFGYPELPPELLQTSVRTQQPEVPETDIDAPAMPPLVKTVRRALRTVEEPEDPEFIEERKKKRISSRFVVYQGADPYQRTGSGHDAISDYALSLAVKNRIAVSREQEPVDGSSFVRKVLYSTRVGMLPRGVERQARAFATSSFFEPVEFSDLQPGDLVFWSGLNAESEPGEPSHVGIFVGEGTVVTQWPGRGILKLRLEGVLGEPQFLRGYRFRSIRDDYRAGVQGEEARSRSSSKRPIQDLR